VTRNAEEEGLGYHYSECAFFLCLGSGGGNAGEGSFAIWVWLGHTRHGRLLRLLLLLRRLLLLLVLFCLRSLKLLPAAVALHAGGSALVGGRLRMIACTAG